jgi:hypothetical protein
VPEHDGAEPEVETAADLPAHDPILPRKPPVSRVLDWQDHGSAHESDYDPYSGKD